MGWIFVLIDFCIVDFCVMCGILCVKFLCVEVYFCGGIFACGILFGIFECGFLRVEFCVWICVWNLVDFKQFNQQSTSTRVWILHYVWNVCKFIFIFLNSYSYFYTLSFQIYIMNTLKLNIFCQIKH